MSLQGIKILVIDDDDKIQRILKRILDSVNAEVYLANDILHGINQIKSHNPKVILLDLNLENESGLNLFKYRDLRQELSESIVILLSGEEDMDKINVAFSLGVTDYVPKPLNANFLLSKIKEFTERNEIKPVVLSSPYSIKVKCNVELKGISEDRLIIDAPLKINKNTKVSILDTNENKLFPDNVIFTTERISTFQSKGVFKSSFSIIGANQRDIKSFTKLK